MESARNLPPFARVKSIVVASSVRLKATRTPCHIRKRRRCRASILTASANPAPISSRKAMPTLRPASSHNPLREFLRRRRPELESHRVRRHSLRTTRRTSHDPVRRPFRPRLVLCRRRRSGLQVGRRPELNGLAFNFSIESEVVDLMNRILRAMGSDRSLWR
jgi:hypothetical protein